MLKAILILVVVTLVVSTSQAVEKKKVLIVDVPETPPEIEGAKVSKVGEATKIANRSYYRKVLHDHGISSYEGVGSPRVVSLGFDVPGFARKGDKVWELRVWDGLVEKELRAILWVHSETGEVHFVIGPSIADEKN